jgi:hypothetical protein
MQASVSGRNTTMKALMVNGNYLSEIEEMMPRLSRSLPNEEVAEIANINSRSQVLQINTDCIKRN